MKKSNPKQVLAEFLKEGNYRFTPERFDVLEAALSCEGHFGADELFIKMKNNKQTVSRATVYNTIDLLEKCGILAKRFFGDNAARYEKLIDKQNHIHFVCDGCGKIIEFNNPKLNKLLNEAEKQFKFKRSGYSFNISGKCLNCSRENSNEKSHS